MATEGINNETEVGNSKAPPRKSIIKWIFNACPPLPAEMVKELFTLYIKSSHNGSRDDLIHCFKEGQSPCFQGCEVLRLQPMVLQDKENSIESPSESDVKEAHESCQLLDRDEEDYEEIDIL